MSKRTYISQNAPVGDHQDADFPPDPELNELVRRIGQLAADKKAIDPVAVDLRGASAFTDAFIILTGNTDRQVKAIHNSIHEGMKHEGERRLPRRVEGEQESRWILMDYGDVIVHIFVPETREFYRLESLWGDRARLDIPRAEIAPEPLGEGYSSED